MTMEEGMEATHPSRRMDTYNTQLPNQGYGTSLGGGMTEWMISDADDCDQGYSDLFSLSCSSDRFLYQWIYIRPENVLKTDD